MNHTHQTTAPQSKQTTLVLLLLAAVSLLAEQLLLSAAAAESNERVIYVAPNGRDENPGRKNQPFATPARAMEAVRALVAGGLKNDVRVVLRGGTYPLGAPLVFTSADSGSEEHSITYAAAAGEKA